MPGPKALYFTDDPNACVARIPITSAHTRATAMNARKWRKSMGRESIPDPYAVPLKDVLDSVSNRREGYAAAVWRVRLAATNR